MNFYVGQHVMARDLECSTYRPRVITYVGNRSVGTGSFLYTLGITRHNPNDEWTFPITWLRPCVLKESLTERGDDS